MRIPRLKASAQPLEFLEYLLEATVDVPIINGGATMVKVADPARFALHKLIVSMDRPVAFQAKAAKDRQQAGEMIEVLMQDRPGDIELAAENINARGPGWRKWLKEGVARLPDSLADAKQKILALIS